MGQNHASNEESTPKRPDPLQGGPHKDQGWSGRIIVFFGARFQGCVASKKRREINMNQDHPPRTGESATFATPLYFEHLDLSRFSTCRFPDLSLVAHCWNFQVIPSLFTFVSSTKKSSPWHFHGGNYPTLPMQNAQISVPQLGEFSVYAMPWRPWRPWPSELTAAWSCWRWWSKASCAFFRFLGVRS